MKRKLLTLILIFIQIICLTSFSYVSLAASIDGDTNNDGYVNSNDVVHLLYNVMFGDTGYPIDQNKDYNADNSVNTKDVVYLLYHVMFGDSYPLYEPLETPSKPEGTYTGTYYDDIDFSLTGSALKAELRTLLQSTHTYYTSYDDCKYELPDIDEDPNDPNKMILFYTGESIEVSYDLNHDWNREHVWPQSLGWFKKTGAGSDLHHIRPCNISVNSSRGNKKFGTSHGYYEPIDEYKGDTARIIFYLMVAYTEADNYTFNTVSESVEILLAWNELDPVSSLEISRNDKIEDIQGNRNPFIDYPSLADDIWG
ncbi:MAG: endonuclease [Bacilli bacterium]|nr:endonuclease [Bacilli bacterium]